MKKIKYSLHHEYGVEKKGEALFKEDLEKLAEEISAAHGLEGYVDRIEKTEKGWKVHMSEDSYYTRWAIEIEV